MPILTAQYSYTQSKRNTLETDLATVTFLDAVIQNYEIHLSFDVRPKHEKCFVMDSQHQTVPRLSLTVLHALPSELPASLP